MNDAQVNKNLRGSHKVNKNCSLFTFFSLFYSITIIQHFDYWLKQANALWSSINILIFWERHALFQMKQKQRQLTLFSRMNATHVFNGPTNALRAWGSVDFYLRSIRIVTHKQYYDFFQTIAACIKAIPNIGMRVILYFQLKNSSNQPEWQSKVSIWNHVCPYSSIFVNAK